jgi:hypothetical protein
MIYKKYLALIMVLGLISFEPAAAMQIGSENELYSNSCSSNIFETINKSKTSYGIVNSKIDGNYVPGRNEGFLNMNSEKIKSFKKFSKKTHHIKFIHKFKHSTINKNTNLTVQANIHKNKSESNKDQLSDLNIKHPKLSSDKNIETINSEANINKTHNFNANENKTENDELSLNNQSINHNITGVSDFTDITNDTPEINNINNGTLNSTENNSISNNTQNLTNSTGSSKCEESTKDKVCDTLLAVGYLSAAIAAGCALNPDPLASKVIGAVAVGVAVVSFVAYICIKWFW